MHETFDCHFKKICGYCATHIAWDPGTNPPTSMGNKRAERKSEEGLSEAFDSLSKAPDSGLSQDPCYVYTTICSTLQSHLPILVNCQ